MIPLLTSRQLLVRTVELPSVGAEPGVTVDLSSDAAAVRAVIDEIAGPVLLCGHSYGGMVISHAESRHPRVARLVYLCAFVPEVGESLVDIGGGRLAPWIQDLEGGLMRPDLAQAANLFYADCDAETQSWAVGKIRPQCGAAFYEGVPYPCWKDIPSTYIVCAEDRALPPDWQRNLFAPRVSKRVELNSSHSPFLSQPAALAEVLAVEAASE